MSGIYYPSPAVYRMLIKSMRLFPYAWMAIMDFFKHILKRGNPGPCPVITMRSPVIIIKQISLAVNK
jgi:hypothetical protein